MPHSLRVYRALRAAAIDEDRALAVAVVTSGAQEPPGTYVFDDVVGVLCDGGFAEPLAEDLARTMAACFPSERFRMSYRRTVQKVALVRSGMPADCADALLNAIDPCIRCGRDQEIRAPIQHTPSQGRVVMCDFRFLRKPEMQKERRAIVVSKHRATGRCVIVPVSKNPSNAGHPLHYKFQPGAYPFFHQADPVWAVCDHLYTVSLDRLWQVNVNRRPTMPALNGPDLEAIKVLIGTGVGL